MKKIRADRSDASLNSIEAYLLTGDCSDEEGIEFKNSYVITGNLSAPSIIANYSLTILGNVICDVLQVNKDLIVFGRIDAKHVQVGGEVFIQGDFCAEQVQINGTLQANRIVVQQAVINKQVISKSTIYIQTSLQSSETVIALEGISGSGRIDSRFSICGEYNDAVVNEKGTKLILSDAPIFSQGNIDKSHKPIISSPLEVSQSDPRSVQSIDGEKVTVTYSTEMKKKDRKRLL